MTTDEGLLLTLRVEEARTLKPLIRMLRLRAEDGAVLPPFTAGSHIRVKVKLPDGSEDWRHYSLVNLSAGGDLHTPHEYTIAVRREDDGRGGSRFMHQALQAGDRVVVEAPRNEFPLRDGPGCAVLLAGGIGITPMTSMAAQRRADKLPVRMVYAGRSRELMAFLPQLQDLLGEDLQVHADAEAGGPLDVDRVLDACGDADQLYVCGPKVLLDKVLERTQARGWTHDRVHFELFTTPVAEVGDQPFEVVLSQSGQSFQVPVGQTVLDCLIEHGCDPLFDCKRGECGVCSASVLEGDIDHRDYFLSDAEKASGKVMQICVSRVRGPRLVLDM
ncbi:oxidoreductase [Ramlibacter henchirensis]|uniref:Oxidoreductase n=1 Tax=Ramlibacter henchirensis TaxID=204072 RepID=A0A4Z0BPT2_9BURK|nr:PDR/VanB family oxidoreductase [Ramlibacter henchirensis]TFZ00841.1 oxidoreductase [Ramlibacter henchirensis]